MLSTRNSSKIPQVFVCLYSFFTNVKTNEIFGDLSAEALFSSGFPEAAALQEGVDEKILSEKACGCDGLNLFDLF